MSRKRNYKEGRKVVRSGGHNVRRNEVVLPAGGGVNGAAEAGNIARVLKSGERREAGREGENPGVREGV